MTLQSSAFRAMDTDVDLLACSRRPLAEAFRRVESRFLAIEAAFSRFRAGSLVSRLNSGEAIEDPQLEAVWRMALDAYDQTGGLFNPMILPGLEAAGYRQTFSEVSGGRPQVMPVADPRRAVELAHGCLRLREGAVDLGGIVKGWTVDQVMSEFAGQADAALVNAGGDLLARGDEPGGEGWEMAIQHPHGGVLWQGRVNGALATSSSLRRRWLAEGGVVAHHLIDPRTGSPAESDFVQVSVFAERVAEAEVWSKAILIGGAEAAARAHRHVLAITAHGELREWKPAL